MTAKELEQQLAAGARPVGIATIYRALTALEGAGLVHAVDLGGSERHFELVHADGSHHHHVVCDRCGRTARLQRPRARACDRRGRRAAGRRVDAHDVVLHGECRRCAGA